MQEQSDNQIVQTTQSSVSEHENTSSSSRRRFLTKASVGIVVASMPARSVWASGGGVAQSIVASGHGSDFAEGVKIAVLSAGYWKTHCTTNHSKNFKTVFGGNAFNKTTALPSLSSSLTFGQILLASGKSGLKGPGNCNFHMVAMYLNALHDGEYGLKYPLIGTDQPFKSNSSFAAYLYAKAMQNPSALGTELKGIITTYHVPSIPYSE